MKISKITILTSVLAVGMLASCEKKDVQIQLHQIIIQTLQKMMDHVKR